MVKARKVSPTLQTIGHLLARVCLQPGLYHTPSRLFCKGENCQPLQCARHERFLLAHQVAPNIMLTHRSCARPTTCKPKRAPNPTRLQRCRWQVRPGAFWSSLTRHSIQSTIRQLVISLVFKSRQFPGRCGVKQSHGESASRTRSRSQTWVGRLLPLAPMEDTGMTQVQSRWPCGNQKRKKEPRWTRKPRT